MGDGNDNDESIHKSILHIFVMRLKSIMPNNE